MTPEQLSKEADRCVKCGLCLPQCPTYRLTRDEGDSPRGRIALIQGFVNGTLHTSRSVRHLERCLGCRRCETACPSGVRYGRLIDAARALGERQGGRGRRQLLNLLSRLPYWRFSLPLLRRYQGSAARRLLRRLGGAGLRRLDDMLPGLESGPDGVADRRCNTAAGHRQVALFTGCIGRISDQGGLHAALAVMARLGIPVSVPENQGCCGAMHLHNGFPDAALQRARANSTAFAGSGAEAIVYLASGCGVRLEEQQETGPSLGAPAMEICRYLETSSLAAALQLEPLSGKVVVHTPCTLRYPLNGEVWVDRLLRRIPGIDLEPLPDTGCCGAAGTHVLTQPEMADQLREATLNGILQRTPRILVTGNSGCAMHLRAGLKQRGHTIEVLHPIELIERQMVRQDRESGQEPEK